jgi:transposase InsO family protein
LELAAAVAAIDHFDVYLRGRHFILYTDHKPLEKLSTVHTRTLNRLQQHMLEFDFEMRYKRGSENVVADFFSRNVINSLSDDTGNLEEAQQRDARIVDVRNFLTASKLPDHNKAYAQWVQRIAAKCKFHDGIVWYTLERPNHRTREVLYAPEELRQRLVQAAHLTLEAGHGGANRTTERLYLNYWWPGITNEVAIFIKKCRVCQEGKAKQPAPAPLQSMPICTEPNERVHMDLFGPLKTSGAGNKYILVITDAFSKLTETVAIECKEAEVVARAFFERWICRYSAPKMVVTDQGREFTNKILDEMCSMWGIEKARTSPYHPETNSAAESYNRTIIKYMRAVLGNNSTLDWEEMLPCLMLSYNCHVHRSTLETPFFLTYLHDPRLPYFDLESPRPLYGESYVADAFGNMKLAYKRAKDNMEAATRVSEDYYNKKTKESTFEPEDKVLVYFPNTPPGVNPKFYKKWHLFSVVKMVGPVNVQLRKTPRSRGIIVHVNRLRKATFAEVASQEQAAYLATNDASDELRQHRAIERMRDIARREEEEEEGVEFYRASTERDVHGQSGSEEEEEQQQQQPGGPFARIMDPWYAMARQLYPTTAADTERRWTRAAGVVPEIPLPDRCPAWKTTPRRARHD